MTRVAMIACIWSGTFGCSGSDTYKEVLARELAKEDRYDSLFYGLHFNMTIANFSDHCMEMNRKGIFFQQGMSTALKVHLKDGFRYPVTLVFFPDLDKLLIQQLAGNIYYDGWSRHVSFVFEDLKPIL